MADKIVDKFGLYDFDDVIKEINEYLAAHISLIILLTSLKNLCVNLCIINAFIVEQICQRTNMQALTT